jgi:hypothetical protein
VLAESSPVQKPACCVRVARLGRCTHAVWPLCQALQRARTSQTTPTVSISQERLGLMLDGHQLH